MAYDKPITIEVQNLDTEKWEPWAPVSGEPARMLHAKVNKTGGGTTTNAGADQYRASLTFELRYFKALEDLNYSPQPYRIIYCGRKFKVTDYDDFMEQHRGIKLVGEFYE